MGSLVNHREPKLPQLLATAHGAMRMAQRGVNDDAIMACEDFGRRAPYGPRGTMCYRIDRGVVRRFRRREPRLVGLEGTTVIESPEGAVITAYRNKHGRRLLRKKVKPRRKLAVLSFGGSANDE